jgi:hypothetical protein
MASDYAENLPDVKTSPGLFGLALLPLMLFLPFMYWPKFTDFDTQPTIVAAIALAFVFFWPTQERRITHGMVRLVLLILLAIGVYVARGPEVQYAVRYGLILLTFLALWNLGERGAADYIAPFVRATIVIWFVFGLYQTIGVRLGWEMDFAGRFVASYSGVPSITAEPSYYGSLSILQIMILASNHMRRNIPFYVLASMNVIMSGSLLAFLFMLFPLWLLPLRWKVVGGIAVLVVFLLGVQVLESGFFARIEKFQLSGVGADIMRLDISLNLRFGHIWFIFYENLVREMSLVNSIDFFREYNHWASRNPVIYPTSTDFILPSGGELVFRSGPVGLIIMILIILFAGRTTGNRNMRILKMGFVTACLLNPMSLANPFLIFYIHQKARQPHFAARDPDLSPNIERE